MENNGRYCWRLQASVFQRKRAGNFKIRQKHCGRLVLHIVTNFWLQLSTQENYWDKLLLITCRTLLVNKCNTNFAGNVKNVSKLIFFIGNTDFQNWIFTPGNKNVGPIFFYFGKFCERIRVRFVPKTTRYENKNKWFSKMEKNCQHSFFPQSMNLCLTFSHLLLNLWLHLSIKAKPGNKCDWLVWKKLKRSK